MTTVTLLPFFLSFWLVMTLPRNTLSCFAYILLISKASISVSLALRNLGRPSRATLLRSAVILQLFCLVLPSKPSLVMKNVWFRVGAVDDRMSNKLLLLKAIAVNMVVSKNFAFQIEPRSAGRPGHCQLGSAAAGGARRRRP